MAGGLRAEFEPLHREQEGALRVEGRWLGPLFDDAQLLDRHDVAFRKRRKGFQRIVFRQDFPPSRIDLGAPGGRERGVADDEPHVRDRGHARRREGREESPGD